MSRVLRLALLGLFAAGGVGLAICFAVREKRPAEKHAAPPLAAVARLSPDDPAEIKPPVASQRKAAAPVEIPPPPPLTVVATAPTPPRPSAAVPFAPLPPTLPPGVDASEATALRTNRTSSAASQLLVVEPAPAIEQQVPAPGSPEVRQQVRDGLDELQKLLEADAQGKSSLAQQQQSKAGTDNQFTQDNPPGDKPAAGDGQPSANKSPAAKPGPKSPAKAKPKITKSGEGDDHLSLDFQDTDIREVLELISREGNLNILPSPAVKGRVSASLHDVDIETALAAILKSSGYVTRRQGKFIYVGTAQDFQTLEQSLDKVGTRIYHTNYVKASDLQQIITPLLTPSTGTISVTAPAETGIPDDNTKAGGESFAGGEAVLVRDYEAVLAQIDQVVAEIDKRPLQVAIEAMILSVKLDDQNSFGVNFQLLRDNAHVQLASGNPAQSLSDVSFANGGLQFGFLDSSLGFFLNALESIGDTSVIATPRIMCLNKQRAEILIGSQLGYINSTVTETSTAQSVNFLEVGAQLRLRPFISSDGLIRMEVHPELSTGQVKVQGGFTLPEKDLTQVTTNVMVRDGATVIIGGLMREDLTNTTTEIPLLGSMPGIGWLFRQKTEETQKSEILVLITPHIVYDAEACAEGTKGATEFHRREAVYADQMSPIGRRYIGRKYLRLAQQAWANGDQPLAMRFIDLAIHFDPLNRAAIDLRSDILTGNHAGDHTAVNFPTEAAGDHPLDGATIAPSLIDDLAHPPEPESLTAPPPQANLPSPPGMPAQAGPFSQFGAVSPGCPLPLPTPLHPWDPGQPGSSKPIDRPSQFDAP